MLHCGAQCTSFCSAEELVGRLGVRGLDAAILLVNLGLLHALVLLLDLGLCCCLLLGSATAWLVDTASHCQSLLLCHCRRLQWLDRRSITRCIFTANVVWEFQGSLQMSAKPHLACKCSTVV
jgi:hypothetical protein